MRLAESGGKLESGTAKQHTSHAIQVTFEQLSVRIQGRAWFAALVWTRSMSVYALTDFRDDAGAGEPAGQHLRVWLAATGSSYGARARELFVRAHPVLFGRDFEPTMSGYDRWRWRRRLHDTAATFARYMAPRHERWMAHQPNPSSMAPCLIGASNSPPCWALGGCEPSSAQGELESAA
jgi:hypothetical protein